MRTKSETERDTQNGRQHQTTLTEVWPGQFELEVETGATGVTTTTTHTLETAQLQLLHNQIEETLQTLCDQ